MSLVVVSCSTTLFNAAVRFRGALRLAFVVLTSVWLGSFIATAVADDLALVSDVDAQPLRRQATRIAEALVVLGQPLPAETQAALTAAIELADERQSVRRIQEVLDPLCIAGVNINPESRVKVAPGAVERELAQGGWRVFLVKVHNEAGVTAPLVVTSPNALLPYQRASNQPTAQTQIRPDEVADRWMDLVIFDQQPLEKTLFGLAIEYRPVAIYCRDSGQREGKLMFDVGQGTQDLGFRNELPVLFECLPAVKVVLNVLDEDGTPTIGQFVFRDKLGRVYPSLTRRLAPDLFFHEQVYRGDGENVLLPPGTFNVTYSRGPEYVIQEREIVVPNSAEHHEAFRLTRWIKLASLGWFSGDHHVHAAGCAHYEAPTEGVKPEDMLRHIVGEDLNVGCVLSWGPCWYYQKQFFSGGVSPLSLPNYLMRYDVEVSGFPSSHAGHLCLLRLNEDDYPGTTKIEEWPSWDLPILQWGHDQGGVVGFSHSGWGLQVADEDLPSYEMPKFDGIGANEFIVDTVHGVCDFISAVDTPVIWELSIWYHTLNCGFTTRISGETDFPCIYGERVGLGRAYVKLDPAAGKPLDYDAWAQGIKEGRSYVSDGLSHLPDFRVGELGVGELTATGRDSVLEAKAGEKLPVHVRAAALLEQKPRDDIRQRPLYEKPFWHVERARVGDTRSVKVELVVNGKAVDSRQIEADGKLNDLEFDWTPTDSSWVAIRIFPSSHTNPIFVEVDDRPIRADAKSAEWCRQAVDVCWESKKRAMREEDIPAAQAAYDVARNAYDTRMKEALARAGNDRQPEKN